MAKKGDLYLGALGSEILLPAFGRTFKIDDVELSRKERLASGRLVKEIISVKKKFTLNYSLIDGDDLTEILDIYDLNSELSFLIYTSDTVHNDYIVFMSPIDRTRVLLHDNGLKADNTFYPCPSNVSESRNYEMGWWSDSISGTDNNFSIPYPKLTMTFSERPILALSVIGDDNYNEYPVNFEIKIYGVGDILLHTETVTGNNNVRWFKSIIDEAINSAVKMTLEITRWNQPERVLKIVEFYTSLVETYENEDIVSMNLLEESIISDGSLPIGNISANELDFSLQNVRIFAQGQWINDPFFPGNTNSYLHTLIKNNRRIRVWLGFELPSLAMEYMPLGTFWSGDWTIEETDSMVSTSCRDRMELLRQATFIGDTLYENVSLYTLAIAVLQHAKDNIPMPDLYWSVDIELQNFVVPYAWFARKTYMTAIKDIVTACMGKAYMSREDILIITI